MTEGIIIAIITGLCAVIGQALITASARKKDVAERARLDERTANRLDAIERKLDEHNQYAEKLGDLQRDVALIRQEIHHLEKE